LCLSASLTKVKTTARNESMILNMDKQGSRPYSMLKANLYR